MLTTVHHPALSRARFTAVFSSVAGLFLTLLTIALSPIVVAGAGAGTLVPVTVTIASLAGPYLLALAALRLRSPGVQRALWLACGLAALVPGWVLLASGVGVFLTAAGLGLLAAAYQSWRAAPRS